MTLVPRTNTNQYETQNFTFEGEAWVFINAVRTGWGAFVNLGDAPPIALFFSGNDRRKVLRKHIVRPATGDFLKFNDLTEIRNGSPKKKEQATSSVAESWSIVEETERIKGQLLYTDDPYLKRYFRFSGTNDGTTFSHGGKTTREHLSLLVVRKNNLKQYPDYYECHFYQRGIILPANEPAIKGGIIEFEYLPAMAKKQDGSCETPGKQTMFGWYVRVLRNGTNIPFDPTDYDPANPTEV